MTAIWHLLLIASTFLVVYFALSRLETPSVLRAILSSGTFVAPVILLIISVFLYRKQRTLFGIGLLSAAGVAVILISELETRSVFRYGALLPGRIAEFWLLAGIDFDHLEEA